MKKLSGLFAMALLFTAVTFAQLKEGTIVYIMELPNMPPEQAAMMGNMETVISIKNDKTRTETSTPFYSNVTITDNKTKDVVTLMDMPMMGKKYLIRSKIEEPKDKKAEGEVKVKQLNDKKTIAGYACTNAEVTWTSKDGKEFVTTVWYTKELGVSYEAQFKGLNGVPMEYEFDSNGQKIKMTCKSFSKEPVSDSKFEIPTSGYEEKTQKEMEEMYKGMGK